MTSDPYDRLRELFSRAGYTFVEPPIVHDASAFVDVAGEDLRRRMFLTGNGDGRELALRPEYTVPIVLHHLQTGPAARAASYAYLGPVFRQRKAGPHEFLQAGVESIGRGDSVAADADVLALAFAAADALGVAGSAVTIGDSALFASVLAAIGLPEPWQRRLRRAFGDPGRLSALIASASAGLPHRTADPDRATLEREVRDMFEATGLGVIGARSAAEIADRFLEKDVLAAGIDGDDAARLSEFLAVRGSAVDAVAQLRAFARSAGLQIEEAVDRFAGRNDAFAARGIALDRLRFAADFGRRLDYYTGFVFEFPSAVQRTSPVIGGGRYDRLMRLIHHPAAPRHDIPAVGFAVSLDRVGPP